MKNPLAFSNIRGNHQHGKVADFLKDKISSGSALSMVSAYRLPNKQPDMIYALAPSAMPSPANRLFPLIPSNYPLLID